ncbi:MAG: ABC transporter permease [Woeseiaceae bacterium]
MLRRAVDWLGHDFLGLLLVLSALIVFFGFRSEYFFTSLTFATMANQLPALLVVAVGMTFVLIIAGIDLSVGSVMALCGAVMGVFLIVLQWPLPIAIIACLSVGFLCGLGNGLIVARWGVPSFIVTLGMLEIARGGAYLVTGSQTLFVGSTVEWISAPLPYFGVSSAFIVALIIVILGQTTLSRTVFGRHMIAVGSNAEAVRLSGISVRSVRVKVFGLAGFLAGLGGLFQVGYLQSADPNAGVGLELSAIAAVVIGGTSLAGGRGSVTNTLLGVLIIAVLQTGLAQIGASEPSKRVVTGLVIIAAVIVDVLRHRGGSVSRYFKALRGSN